MVTLPVGADAHLLADARGFRLTLSGHPVLE
jgi:muramoyltetrapeptide carboxypeptidase